MRAGPILDVPIAEAEAVFNTNYFATIRLAQAIIPYMAARKRGLIINMGSILGEVPSPFVGHYAASKAALQSVTEVLRMECRPLGVQVTLIIAGTVKSNVSVVFLLLIPPNLLIHIS